VTAVWRRRFLTVRLGRFNRRVDRRPLVVALIATGVLVVVVGLALADGAAGVAVVDVVRILVLGDELPDRFVVVDVRLPRVLAGVLAGGMLGMSGGLLQTLSTNPLVAPDVIGINAGAALGAVAAITLGAPYTSVPFAALAGAAATTVVVVAVSYRHGLAPMRVVLIGIGVQAAVGSFITYLLTQSDEGRFARASVWLVGSLSSIDWSDVRTLAATAAVVTLPLLVLIRPLRAVQLGDHNARALGVRLDAVRLAVLLAVIGYSAGTVAMVGPIGFVSFVAPHIARRLARTSAPSYLPVAALAGATLVVLGDLAGKLWFRPHALPVGIVTILIGAPYLLWLLHRSCA